MSRVLIVDDEPQIRRALTTNLRARGYEVDEAQSGEEALRVAARVRPDLVVLDLGLPDIDGIEVVHGLRGWTQMPILVLSAREDEDAKVAALDAGADDYVTKPVGVAELRSRVGAAMRRLAPRAVNGGTPLLAAWDVTLDPSSRTVRAAGGDVALTQSEFAVLEALLRAGGAVLSRQQLLQAIFGDHAYRDPRAIDFHVHHVRDKLQRAGAGADVIATVRGAGYRVAP